MTLQNCSSKLARSHANPLKGTQKTTISVCLSMTGNIHWIIQLNASRRLGILLITGGSATASAVVMATASAVVHGNSKCSRHGNGKCSRHLLQILYASTWTVPCVNIINSQTTQSTPHSILLFLIIHASVATLLHTHVFYSTHHRRLTIRNFYEPEYVQFSFENR